MFEDAARTATDQWLCDTLTARGLGSAVDDPEWPALLTRAREAALAGHDLIDIVQDAVRMRPVDDAHSVAAVLHWRLDQLAPPAAVPHAYSMFGALPPTCGPDIDIARQAGELIWRRWQDLHRTLDATTGPLPGAEALGARPADPEDRTAWLGAVTAITAYRERYEIPDHTPMLGPRPGASRPEARTAWDYARHQADRYLARRLRHLDDQRRRRPRLRALAPGPGSVKVAPEAPATMAKSFGPAPRLARSH